MTVLAGAACQVCGGGCTAFPDVEHTETYPFLPGGVPMATNDKTADGRLFDANGVLVAGEGASIPDGVDLFDEAGKPYKPSSKAAEVPVKAADTSAQRKPRRETR